MAILTKLEDVYAALDEAVDAMDSGDEQDTVAHIATYLKNRRGVLSEIVYAPADSAVQTFAEGDAEIVDHLG